MNNKKRRLFGGAHLSLQDKINFARHLSITIKAGLPLLEGIRIIRRQATKRSFGRVLDDIIQNINNGQTLADSLDNFRSTFGDFFINIIRIGESSGTLGANLLYLADELQKNRALKKKVRGAMVYPIAILIATVGITMLLLFFVFPKVIPIFSSLNVKLPLTTVILINILNFTSAYGLWVVVGLFVFSIGFRLMYRLPRVKYLVHLSFLYIPVLSRLIVNINMAHLSRVLGVLLKSGTGIVEAVNITGRTFSNMVYRKALEDAAERIRRGEQFAEYLRLNHKFFPMLLSSMIEIGENTGNLEENLFYLFEYYTEEVDDALKNLTTFLEPLLIVIMGFVVGFIAISIITPIYSITQGIGGK